MSGRAVRSITLPAVAGIALLIALAVYLNAIPGQFVYDDTLQIARNPLIQEPRLFWKAMSSDVWAFKGAQEEPWSNYWRPMFILWLMAGYRLFGLAPAGWHVASILLHGVVILLAADVLRRLHVRPAACAIVLWIFAAHPVHVESVAWISGSTDLLLAAFLLASHAAYLARRSTAGSRVSWLSLALFAAAALSKEVGLVFPVVILISEWTLDAPGRGRHRLARSLAATAPYLAVAVVILIARFLVLGTLGQSTPWTPGWASLLLSLPRVFAFYLRQALWPATLGPTYPLRPVDPGALGATDFFVPVLVLLAFAGAAWFVWSRGAVYRIGLAWFVVPLLPALNLATFLPERIVHDRFLYLPLLGLLMIVASAAQELADRGWGSPRAADRTLYGAALAASVVLGAATFRYNRVWHDEVALWERAVEVDPRSTWSLGQLGDAYRRAGRTHEAKQMLERALEINPRVTQVVLDLGLIALTERRFDEAERRFEQVLASYPTNRTALEQLGATFVAQGRPERAEQVFATARERLSDRRVVYTINIAVLNKRMNRPERALAELESIAGDLDSETDPESLRGYFFLGELYREAGRADDAERMYRRYLDRTEKLSGAEVLRYREIARRQLAARS